MSKIPEGATHFVADQYYKELGKLRWAMWWHSSSSWKELSSYVFYSLPQPITEHPDYVAPALEWTGEGLPPVGVRIEKKHKDAQPDWANPGFHEDVIVAIGKQLVIFQADGSGYEKVGRLADYDFRPIRTPDQIAANEREKVVDEMLKCITMAQHERPYYLCLATALAEAGYRKQATE